MDCIAVFQTITGAQRASRTLRNAKIMCDLVKVDPERTKRGCSWGVAFSANRLYDVKMIFAEKNIPVNDILYEG